MADILVSPSSAPLLPEEGGILASEQSLRDIAAAVARRQWVVGLVFLITVAIGTWRTMTEQRVYGSSVTVRVERGDNPIANAPSSGQQYDFRVDPLVSEQQVIKSQTVAERTAQAAGLQLNVVRPARILLSTILGDRLPVLRREVLPGDFTLRFDATQYRLVMGGRQYGPVKYGDTLDIGAIALSVPSRPAIRGDEAVLSIASLGGVARDQQPSAAPLVD